MVTTLAEDVGNQFATGLETAVNAQSTNLTDVAGAALVVFSLLVIMVLLHKIFYRVFSGMLRRA